MLQFNAFAATAFALAAAGGCGANAPTHENTVAARAAPESARRASVRIHISGFKKSKSGAT